jgi:hypothetical protein
LQIFRLHTKKKAVIAFDLEMKELISVPGCSLSAGSAVFEEACELLRLQANQDRNKLPRRMPCEKDFQVSGTLIPLESRTFHSNQVFIEADIRNNNLLEIIKE